MLRAWAYVVVLAVVGAVNAGAAGEAGHPAPESPDPQQQADLPQMLTLEWSAGRPMPQGMQDNHVTLIDNWLVSVGGFCQGGDDDWKPGKYPRGFLNKTWGLDLDNPSAEWADLPDYPGAPRQGAQGARVAGSLYLWGGFSYSEPYTYRDGHRLSRVDGEWHWTSLPPLPSPAAWSGMSSIGTRIYAVGGADYDAQRFYTLTDRTGAVKRLGSRLIVFDTKDTDAGWTEQKECPGTPRCLTTAAVVNGKIYVMGGVGVMQSGSDCNVVDSWRYDPAAKSWERLRDMPISGTGSTSSLAVYKDRYIVLPCGYQYGEVMKPDGSLAALYGKTSQIERTWKSHPHYKSTRYTNHCYVYDTKTNLYGTATPLPFDDVASITVIEGDTAYLFPGETGGFVWEGEYFGHHPEFVLKAAIQECAWE